MMTGSENAIQICVYAQQNTVGTVTFNSPQSCVFNYSDHWVKIGYPISPHIPFSGEYSDKNVIRFIRNLFPEGSALDRLLETENLSKNNVYAILRTIGADTAGLLTFSTAPIDRGNDAPILRHVTDEELAERLREQRDMTYWDGKYRLSLAGVQNKLNVFSNSEEQLFLAGGAYSSTHILKFSSKKYPSIVINEFICMRLAKALNLSCAEVKLRQINEFTALMVERFDRKQTKDGVRKRHIIDGCQALDMPPESKYEQNYGNSRDVKHIREGVSLPKLFSFANQTRVPAQTRLKLLDGVIFNLIIGNSDAHGKNFSFFVGKNDGVSIAPLYDLVSVIYEARQTPNLDTNLAMAIGDNFDIESISAFDLLNFSEQVAIDPSFLKRRIIRFCHLIKTIVPQLDLSPETLSAEHLEHVTAMKALIMKRAQLLHRQALLFDDVRREAF